MPDEIIREIHIPMPQKGLMDGQNPELPDDLFPPVFYSELENVRVADGQIKSRLGMRPATPNTIPGSGDVRMLADFYTDTGGRFRLAARGSGSSAILYDFEEGVDTAFVATTGGTGLGGPKHPYFQGVIQGNRFYFTDRHSALRRYEPNPVSGNQVRAISQPAAPTVAPTVTPLTFRILDRWPGTAPFGWTESDSADFDVIDNTSIVAPPDGGKTVRLRIKNSGAVGDVISKDITGEILNSNTIAFWLRANSTKSAISFQWGSGSPADFSFTLKASKKFTWLPQFIPNSLPSINFKRFRCFDTFENDVFRVTTLYLPGRLQGMYRWVYTHFDPATGRESAPSPISAGGNPVDFSLIGQTNQPTTAQAFQKSAAITVTSDSDPATPKINIYRNGGTPALTLDSRGRTVWFRVGQINDFTTTLASAASAGSTTISVTSASGISVDDLLVINKGVAGSQEFVRVISISGTTLTIENFSPTPGLLFSHSAGESVQIAFHDNVPNEQVNTLLPIDLERGDPPAGVRFIDKSPDGRLWLFGNAEKPTQVCVSNKSTPERPEDYEVFPDGVDPLVRKSPTQGWRFQLGGAPNDEEIIWGGFYRDVATILTRRNLYVINAASQIDWGPLAVAKLYNVGCIAGDTVKEVNGVLYWVADGPRIVRWDGTGPPEVISHLRVNDRLNRAPTSRWIHWFAIYHAKREGPYYCLYYTPPGEVLNVQRLDYNVLQDAWEPVVYYYADGSPIGWAAASVRSGSTDISELYQVNTIANIYRAEISFPDVLVPLTDVPIRVRAKTKKFDLGAIGLLKALFARFRSAHDTFRVTVTAHGAEYGVIEKVYPVSMGIPSGLVEVKIRLDRSLIGRLVDITVTAETLVPLIINDMKLWWLVHRMDRILGTGDPGALALVEVPPNVTTENMLFWFRADAISGLNNAPIGSWPDSGPYGLAMRFPSDSGGTEARWIDNQINGLPAVEVLTGVQGEIPHPNFETFINDQSLTVYWVGNYNNVQAGNGILLYPRTTTGFQVIRLAASLDIGGSNGVGWEHVIGGVSVPVFVAEGASGTQLLTWVIDKTTGIGRIFRNGTLIGSSADIGGTGPGTGFDWGHDAIEFFASGAGANPMRGLHAELIAYHAAHDTATRTAIEGYLKAKYGIP